MLEPNDGFSSMEKILLREMILVTYRNINDVTDKFIMMAIHEGNYSQEDVGTMLGISQEAVSKRITKSTFKLKELRKLGKL